MEEKRGGSQMDGPAKVRAATLHRGWYIAPSGGASVVCVACPPFTPLLKSVAHMKLLFEEQAETHWLAGRHTY